MLAQTNRGGRRRSLVSAVTPQPGGKPEINAHTASNTLIQPPWNIFCSFQSLCLLLIVVPLRSEWVTERPATGLSVFLSHFQKIEWRTEEASFIFLWQLNAPICLMSDSRNRPRAKNEPALRWLFANVIFHICITKMKLRDRDVICGSSALRCSCLVAGDASFISN